MITDETLSQIVTLAQHRLFANWSNHYSPKLKTEFQNKS